MNKFLTSAAAIAILAGTAGMARADDSVTVNGISFYGVIDVNTTYQTHGTPVDNYSPTGLDYMTQKADDKARFSFSNNAMSQSKLGVKGATDVGNDWTALFKLEAGINPASGTVTDGIKSVTDQNGRPVSSWSGVADSSLAGQAFGSAAYAGISNPKYGTLTGGLQSTINTDNVGSYDPVYGAYAFSVIGFSGATGGAGNTQDKRWANSVKYMYSYGPFRAAAMYQFAGTIGTDDNGYQGDIGFDYAGLSMDATYTVKHDEIGAGPLSAQQVSSLGLTNNSGNAFAATVSDNDVYSIFAKYKATQVLTFMGGYENITYKNPSHPIAPGTVDIGGYDMVVTGNSAFPKNKVLQVMWFGGRWDPTPKLEIATGYYHYIQNNFAASASACAVSDTASGQCSGTLNAISLTADYHFTKRFDIYTGAMWSQVLGGIANGYLHNNTIDPTVGFRYSF